MATTISTALPPVVSRAEWLEARKRLLAREKEVTRLRDSVNAERRRLPMVRIEKEYHFDGRDGRASLLDLFDGRAQLFVHHFMWIDTWDEACPSCSDAADVNFNSTRLLALLNRHDVAFAAVCRAPFAKLERFRAEMGWSFPFYSSYGTEFNRDFHVTLDETRTPIEYNYRSKGELIEAGFTEAELTGDWPGISVFLRDGDRVFHTYSAYSRGLDQLATLYNFLDLTPFGRQEGWEDSPVGWPRWPTAG